MSLIDKIPLGGEPFEGFEKGANLMHKLLAAPGERKAREAETQYKMGHLDIIRQAEQRAQQTMPYLIQQYQDIHGQRMSEKQMRDLYNNEIKKGLMGGSSNNQNYNQGPSQSQGMQPQQEMPGAPQSLPFTPMQQEGQQQAPSPQQQYGYTSVNQQQPDMGMIQNLMNPQQGQAPVPSNNPSMQSSPQEQISNRGMEQTQDNGEEIVRPPNPRLSNLDKIAGLPKSPVPAPKTEIDRKNGYIYTQYPSGKITRQKMEGTDDEGNPYRETPEQKEAREERKEERKEKRQEKAADRKDAPKLRESARTLKDTVTLAQDIEDLLLENKNLTGKESYTREKLGWNPPKKLGTYTEKVTKLQAELARLGSKMGGKFAIAWAKGGKPSTWQDVPYNLEMVRGIIDDAESKYNDLSSEYKEMMGTDLPVKFNFYKRIKTPEGKVIKVSSEGARQLIKDHPGHKIIG